MIDKFASFLTGLTAPAEHAFAITPDDATEFSQPTRAIYVGNSGNISVLTIKDETVVLPNAQVGSTISIRAKRVNTTGTTASNLVGFY